MGPVHCTALHCTALHCIAEMKAYTALRIFLLFLVVSPGLSAPQIKSAEDRFFCKLTAPQTCANSCAGQLCTEHCVVICGFWFFYRRLCSAVASTTCVPATTAAAPTT